MSYTHQIKGGWKGNDGIAPRVSTTLTAAPYSTSASSATVLTADAATATAVAPERGVETIVEHAISKVVEVVMACGGGGGRYFRKYQR